MDWNASVFARERPLRGRHLAHLGDGVTVHAQFAPASLYFRSGSHGHMRQGHLRVRVAQVIHRGRRPRALTDRHPERRLVHLGLQRWYLGWLDLAPTTLAVLATEHALLLLLVVPVRSLLLLPNRRMFRCAGPEAHPCRRVVQVIVVRRRATHHRLLFFDHGALISEHAGCVGPMVRNWSRRSDIIGLTVACALRGEQIHLGVVFALHLDHGLLVIPGRYLPTIFMFFPGMVVLHLIVY